MGGFTAFRNHLFNLFPHLFARNIDASTTFCMIIVDLMQFLAGKVKHTPTSDGNTLDIDGVARSMRHVVESYMYSNEYRATKSLVALFDTPKNVPTNKAGTQKRRDTITGVILNAAEYERHRASSPAVALGDPLKWPLNGETIWRSNNLKFQLSCHITEELLRIVPQSERLKLVIDDGVAIHRDLYRERREEMIAHYYFKEKSAYEQECLVSSLARHHFTERFLVSKTVSNSSSSEPGSSVNRLPQTGTGEADVKIPRFIVYGNNTHRYLVVSQDTDIIFILLLHLKSLAPFKEGLEVWLDTQTPVDRQAGVSRSYRFINVVALYNAIHELFEREYPGVKNPIETLVFLTYSLATDFTTGFDASLQVTYRALWNTFSALHTPNDVIQQRGYLLFNDHMYDEQNPVKGAKLESMGVRRGERFCPYPEKWRSVLNTAVVYGYDTLREQYDIVLDDVKCQSFLYLVCQLKVLDLLSSLGHTQFDKKKGALRTYIPTSDELFIWTAEIEAKLETYRTTVLTTEKQCNEKKRKAEDDLLSASSSSSSSLTQPEEGVKKAKLSVASLKRPVNKKASPQPRMYNFATMDKDFTVVASQPTSVIGKMIIDIKEVDEIVETVEEEMDVEVKPGPLSSSDSAAVKKKLAELLKKPLPKDHGIPRLDAMIARIYRTQWVMNYHQNGWKTQDYMTNFADPYVGDETLSCHGWKAREIVQNEESIKRGDFNSAYYTSVYQEGIQPGVIPFRVFEMVETDQIYNRNHTAYLDFGV